MKKYALFFVCCLMFFTAAATFAQVGFTGPQIYTGQTGFTGTEQVQIVTVAQTQTFYDKAPVIIKGNIVQAIGGDKYIFRDSSGDIILKIGPREWVSFGSTIGPLDTVEISGEVHRDKKNRFDIQIHAKYIRKV